MLTLGRNNFTDIPRYTIRKREEKNPEKSAHALFMHGSYIKMRNIFFKAEFQMEPGMFCDNNQKL